MAKRGKPIGAGLIPVPDDFVNRYVEARYEGMTDRQIAESIFFVSKSKLYQFKKSFNLIEKRGRNERWNRDTGEH